MRQSNTSSGRGLSVLLAWVLAAIASVGLLVAAGPAGAATPAWTTYGHDSARSQTDPDSASPVAPTPAWTSASLDGIVLAQPLVDGNLVYVATENDSIYALNSATGAVVWQRSVGTPVPSKDVPCGDISPTVGITGTPVIDPSTNEIYAVADTISGATVSHQLVALNAATGAPVAGFPRPVDPSSQDPRAILQRTALALDAGRVVFGYGGNDGDCSSYHGYLVSAPANGSGANGVFTVDSASGESQGSIWGAGDGPSQDSSGDLFIETGNGNSTNPDLQESVVELNSTAGVLAHWTPSNWKQLDTSDTDLGSAEPLPLPGGLLFVAGKDGVGRLISATNLNGTGQVFMAQACSSGGVYGASLYVNGHIYVPCSGGLVALSLNPLGPSFTKDTSFSAPSGASGPPIYAGGLVWSTGWRSTQLLYGLNPSTGAVSYQTSPGSFQHFVAPSAGGGRLFVAASSKVTALTIAAYTASPSPTPTPTPVPAPTSQPHAAAPVISHASLHPRRATASKGTTLRYTVSQAGSITVTINRLLAGRRSHRRCIAGAHRGRRCTVSRRVRRITIHVKAGSHRLHLRLRGLAPGSYAVVVQSRNAGGLRSRPVTLRLAIVRPRRR